MDGFPTISRNTVTRYLKEKGIQSYIAAQKPKLTEAAKRRREEYSLANLMNENTVWRKTVFIDEFSIETRYKRKRRVKREKNQRFSPQNLDVYSLERPESLSFMACFSFNGIGPIKVINGRSNAECYLDYLANYVIPYANSEFGANFYLLQDNAPIHTARIVRQYLYTVCPNAVHLHPPHSPDLNPIENLGNAVKLRISKYLKVREPNGLSLESMVRASWAEVGDDINSIHKLVDSMRNRYTECIDAAGNPTRY